MATKTSTKGREYEINGKSLVWHPEDDEGAAGNLPDVRIPLRLKLKLLRSLSDREMNHSTMFDMLGALIPNQSDALDEMDINDFQDMFETWQSEYNTLTGASLGESGGSSI